MEDATTNHNDGNNKRKWHTKSRRGCQACKRRKVKCDEQRPSCHKCLKRGVKCDFSETDSTPVPQPPPAQLELELLHNFVVSTALTVSKESHVRDLWRVVVPQIGFSTRYILDGILAFSALHMARYNPLKRDILLSQATVYHTASLKEALPLISTISSENCSNLFLFGVLTLYFNLGSPKGDDDILLRANRAVPEWLYLLRGISSLVDADKAIFMSPVSLIFKRTTPTPCFWESLEHLEHDSLNELESSFRNKPDLGDVKRATLLEAVDRLKRSYDLLRGEELKDHDKLRAIYGWLFDVSDTYLKLLKEADNEALCVFAFFSVLLKDFESYWWVEGWAVHIISKIYDLLDEEYRLWIRWPIEEIGWVCTTH